MKVLITCTLASVDCVLKELAINKNLQINVPCIFYLVTVNSFIDLVDICKLEESVKCMS